MIRLSSVCVCVFAVKVVLVPDGHVMTVAFPIRLSIQDLKCLLASELRVPVEVLRISLDGTEYFLRAPARRVIPSANKHTQSFVYSFKPPSFVTHDQCLSAVPQADCWRNS